MRWLFWNFFAQNLLLELDRGPPPSFPCFWLWKLYAQNHIYKTENSVAPLLISYDLHLAESESLLSPWAAVTPGTTVAPAEGDVLSSHLQRPSCCPHALRSCFHHLILKRRPHPQTAILCNATVLTVWFVLPCPEPSWCPSPLKSSPCALWNLGSLFPRAFSLGLSLNHTAQAAGVTPSQEAATPLSLPWWPRFAGGSETWVSNATSLFLANSCKICSYDAYKRHMSLSADSLMSSGTPPTSSTLIKVSQSVWTWPSLWLQITHLRIHFLMIHLLIFNRFLSTSGA